MKKVDIYADNAPSDTNGAEFIQYFDENPEPKRFTVKINKQEDTQNA